MSELGPVSRGSPLPFRISQKDEPREEPEAAGTDRAPEPPVQPSSEPAAVVEATETSEQENDEDASRGKGVVRLLLAGHFKGVADVRLRINFHEELQAVQASAVSAAVGDETEDLVEAVTGGLEELASSGLLEEEQVAEVQQLAEEFRSVVAAAQQDSADGVLDAVQSAFDSLSAGLNALIPAEPDVEEPGPADGGEVAEEPAQEVTPRMLISAIEEAYARAFHELADAFTSTRVLPELSPPEGKGGAYARFLGLYEALYGSEDSTGAVGEDEEGTTDVTV